ncbi:MAG: plasmid mobilization protein [Polyangiales bacterium]
MSSRLSVYLAPEEHWHIRDKANAHRMSINDYVRSILLADMK